MMIIAGSKSPMRLRVELKGTVLSDGTAPSAIAPATAEVLKSERFLLHSKENRADKEIQGKEAAPTNMHR